MRAPLWRVLSVVAAGILAGVALYAMTVEPWEVIETHVSIPIPGLSVSLSGYRILLLSDFEATEPGSRERQVEAIARRVRPDLVLVAGDLVDKAIEGRDRVEGYRRMAAFLGGLPAVDGVWFVQGHGESASRIDDTDLRDALETAGVRPLLNEVALVGRPGAPLAIIGVRNHNYAGKGKWTILPDGTITEGPGSRESYLELVEHGSEGWTDYEVTGRMRFESPSDWAGFMLRSRLGQREDRFYLAVRRSHLPFLGALAHGTVYTHGIVSARRVMKAGVWHLFRGRVESSEAGVRIRARAWAQTDAEPDTWDVDYVDATTTRIESGTVGLYGEGPGTKTFADLVVSVSDGSGRWEEPRGADFLMQLLAEIPDDTPTIVLSHIPDIYPDAAALGIPLVLAGHTQGGQIRMPFVGPIVVDTSVGRDRAAGLSGEPGRWLYVTRGIGTSRVPMRLLTPPEATVITLTAGDGD